MSPTKKAPKKACGAKWRKRKVTDRAYRYRANSAGCAPPPPHQCAFCGAKQHIDVHHIDGHEENTNPDNLIHACRSCNTKIGGAFKRAGRGRRTRQFNPEGAKTLAEWMAAVMSVKGESDQMSLNKAVETIRATSPGMRSGFARDIWKRRHARRNPEETDELDQAAEVTAAFHGRPPKLIREVTQTEEAREDLADLGRLVELELRSGEALEFRPGVRVAYSAAGEQIYLVGGDQAVPIAGRPRDFQDLGEVHAIVYFTSKAFHNFKPTDYHHEFGEDGGRRPRLTYDAVNRRLLLAGGTYHVTPAGIEN